MPRPSRTPWSIPFVVALMLLGVGIGLAAALLVSPAGVAPTSTGNPGLVTLLTFRTASIAILVLTGLMVAGTVLFNASGGGRMLFRPLMLAFVAFVITAVIVLVVLRVLAPAATDWFQGGAKGPPIPPLNATGNSTHEPGVNNTTAGPPPEGTSLLGTLVFGGVVALAVVVALVVVALSRMRRPPMTPLPPVSAGPALLKALDVLENEESVDVRAVIIELYSQLLHRIDPFTSYTGALSAREIAAESIRFLGIHADTAHELTALFEEARYSTHPLPQSAADRARKALRKALTEYRRNPVAS
jgi:hypothetical protein